MKGIVTFSFLLVSLRLFADWSGLTMDYKVISDEWDLLGRSGYYRISGTVYMNDKSTPVLGSTVTIEDQSIHIISDSLGAYDMMLPLKYLNIYCYKEGLNEVVATYNFQDRHHIVMDFYLTEPIILSDTVIQVEPQPIYTFKPVLYVYNSNLDPISIDINAAGTISYVYPICTSNDPSKHAKWKVRANSAGMITNLADNKVYPYLFWDGINNQLMYKKENEKLLGNVVEKDNIVSFLENTLEVLGLNYRERTDFITFWGPKMNAKSNVFVQFLLDDEYGENVADIIIKPKPDSMRRIYLLFTSLEDLPEDFEYIKQEFNEWERDGFTVVEWGGSEIELNIPNT